MMRLGCHQRCKTSAAKYIVSQLQEHLAEAQAQIDDWSFRYDQEYGDEYEVVHEGQEEEEEAAEAHQVEPTTPNTLLPITPPSVQRPVPLELLPPKQIPSLSTNSADSAT